LFPRPTSKTTILNGKQIPIHKLSIHWCATATSADIPLIQNDLNYFLPRFAVSTANEKLKMASFNPTVLQLPVRIIAQDVGIFYKLYVTAPVWVHIEYNAQAVDSNHDVNPRKTER
jgi:hypothetical protein